MTALATSEFGLLPHALQILSLNTSRLIGVSVPNVYFIKNVSTFFSIVKETNDCSQKEIEEEDGRSDRIVAKLLIVRTLQVRLFGGIRMRHSSVQETHTLTQKDTITILGVRWNRGFRFEFS